MSVNEGDVLAWDPHGRLLLAWRIEPQLSSEAIAQPERPAIRLRATRSSRAVLGRELATVSWKHCLTPARTDWVAIAGQSGNFTAIAKLHRALGQRLSRGSLGCAPILGRAPSGWQITTSRGQRRPLQGDLKREP